MSEGYAEAYAAAQEAATPESLMQRMRGHVNAETSSYFMRAALGG